MAEPSSQELQGLLEAGVNLSEVTGAVKMECVRGRTVATRSFAKYPLKFMVPSRVAQGGVDAVWVYVITYGGGIVSGDTVSFTVDVGPGCTGALTTQTSTKVYHSNGGQGAEQALRASVGSGALLALVPDPVTCFQNADYAQRQTFSLMPDSSLVLVDWLTSGRRERGEVWAFRSYTSSNRVLVSGRPPLLSDTVHLGHGAGLSVAQRMQGLHVMAVVLFYGPRVREARSSMEAGARRIAHSTFNRGRPARNGPSQARRAGSQPPSEAASCTEVSFASCSELGLQGEGLLVRVAATTTEAVYRFLRAHLAPLESELGSAPYASLG